MACKRILTLSACLVVSCCSIGFAQTATSRLNAYHSSSRRVVKNKLAARDLLRKQIDSIDWQETPFEEVVEWLRSEGDDKVNVILRWTAMENEGVDGESPVTLKLRDVTVAEILIEVMDQLSDEGLVSFHAKGRNIRISTVGDFSKKLVRRIYQMTDLTFSVPDFGRNAPQVDLNSASRSSKGGGGGRSVFSGSNSSSSEDLEIEDEDTDDLISDLITAIASTIEPQSWGPITGLQGPTLPGGGGGRGFIQSYNDRVLIVYNTVEVHEQIAGYFALGE